MKWTSHDLLFLQRWNYNIIPSLNVPEDYWDHSHISGGSSRPVAFPKTKEGNKYVFWNLCRLNFKTCLCLCNCMELFLFCCQLAEMEEAQSLHSACFFDQFMIWGVAQGITTPGLKTDVHVQIEIAPEASISMFCNAQFVDRIWDILEFIHLALKPANKQAFESMQKRTHQHRLFYIRIAIHDCSPSPPPFLF